MTKETQRELTHISKSFADAVITVQGKSEYRQGVIRQLTVSVL
jgi:hypothetical protein